MLKRLNITITLLLMLCFAALLNIHYSAVAQTPTQSIQPDTIKLDTTIQSTLQYSVPNWYWIYGGAFVSFDQTLFAGYGLSVVLKNNMLFMLCHNTRYFGSRYHSEEDNNIAMMVGYAYRRRIISLTCGAGLGYAWGDDFAGGLGGPPDDATYKNVGLALHGQAILRLFDGFGIGLAYHGNTTNLRFLSFALITLHVGAIGFDF